jgi:hypothetical protein
VGCADLKKFPKKFGRFQFRGVSIVKRRGARRRMAAKKFFQKNSADFGSSGH